MITEDRKHLQNNHLPSRNPSDFSPVLWPGEENNHKPIKTEEKTMRNKCVQISRLDIRRSLSANKTMKQISFPKNRPRR